MMRGEHHLGLQTEAIERFTDILRPVQRITDWSARKRVDIVQDAMTFSERGGGFVVVTTPSRMGSAGGANAVRSLTRCVPYGYLPNWLDALTGLFFGHVIRNVQCSPLPHLPAADEVH